MSRTTGLVLVAVLTMLFAVPRTAQAWSERSDMAEQYGGRNFADPDDRIERMTGRSEDGTKRPSSSFGGQQDGGWSFSMTQRQSPSPSPFNSLFAPAWQDRQR